MYQSQKNTYPELSLLKREPEEIAPAIASLSLRLRFPGSLGPSYSVLLRFLRWFPVRDSGEISCFDSELGFEPFLRSVVESSP